MAVDAGADAVGFVFYEKSPRCVSVEVAREIVKKLPESVEKVGVFVGESQEDWVHVVLRARLTAVQRYVLLDSRAQPRPPSAIGAIVFPTPPKLFVAFPASRFIEKDLDEAQRNALGDQFMQLRKDASRGSPPFSHARFDTIFLDSGGQQQPGGTGRPFEWAKAIPVAELMREAGLKPVVAGGLTPENVSEAIETLRPWGVDVASGVEARPGKKDAEKVRAFVRAVRECDRKTG